ncbi:MAG: DUF2007 domain-containing protein [Candidatus Aminicenantales bacterium]
MICPKCGVEYRPGFTQCSDCLVALADESKPAKPRWSRPAELVTVFKCADAGRIALAKSLLQSAGTRFLVRNEAAQNLFGKGSTHFGGPAEFQVDREDAADAKALLKDLEPHREQSGSVEADNESNS